MPLMRTPLLVLPGCGLECPHRSPHAACPYILQKGCLKTPEGKGQRGEGTRHCSGHGGPALENSSFLNARLWGLPATSLRPFWSLMPTLL